MMPVCARSDQSTRFAAEHAAAGGAEQDASGRRRFLEKIGETETEFVELLEHNGDIGGLDELDNPKICMPS